MKIDSTGLWLATKYVGIKRIWQFKIARKATRKDAPQLLVAYAAFGRTQQSGSPRQPFKGWDLWKVLQVVRPQSIIELGSGTTSAVFALWSQRSGASYTSYEHCKEWADVTVQCLTEAGLAPAAGEGIICVPTQVSDDHSSVGFKQPLPHDSELLYIDGPPCVLDSGQKVPNDDATRLLDSGALPKAIVVDGRVETVDLLLKHPAIGRYTFLPGLAYCLSKGLFRQVLAGREHSVFLRK
jgi:hypothetical protein